MSAAFAVELKKLRDKGIVRFDTDIIELEECGEYAWMSSLSVSFDENNQKNTEYKLVFSMFPISYRMKTFVAISTDPSSNESCIKMSNLVLISEAYFIV